jgi:hypothetical protein
VYSSTPCPEIVPYPDRDNTLILTFYTSRHILI